MPFNPDTPRSRDEVLLQAIVSGDSSMMGDPRDREEEFVKAIADKETLPDYSEASEGDVIQIGADGPEWGPADALPDYSGASAGDALIIGNDGPEWGAIPNELPAIAAGDAGKVLKVNSGETGVEWGAAGEESKKYYLHLVTGISHSQKIEVSIITSSATPFTSSTLNSYLYSLGTSAGGTSYPASGAFFDGSTLIIVRGIYWTTSAPTLFTRGVTITDGALAATGFGSDSFNFSSDTVKEI